MSKESPTAKERDAVISEHLQKVKKLQDDVLRARERLRNKNGALKEATNDMMNGLADILQLKIHFGPDEKEEEEGDEPEDLKATG